MKKRGPADRSIAEAKRRLKEQMREYHISLMHDPGPGEPWGLFKYTKDAKMPYSFVATADAWGMMGMVGGIETLPGYHPKAREELAAFVKKFQDPKTGFFREPYLDAKFIKRTDEEANRKAFEAYQRAVTKYAVALLGHCRAKPLYPVTFSMGKAGKFDPEAYIQYIKTSDWNLPWGAGSHSGLATIELFNLVCKGREDLIPVLKEGIELILSHQNPKTGMWGPKTIPLTSQLGGALKITSRFQPYMGLIVPHMDKLADSIIKHNRSLAFYNPSRGASVPRNVAVVAHMCIVASEYRREELWKVIADTVRELESFRQPDGGFSYTQDGRRPKVWCGARAEGVSEKPRSDVHGTINIAGSLLSIYSQLGRTRDDDTVAERWRKGCRKLKYRVYVDKDGKVHVEPQKAAKD